MKSLILFSLLTLIIVSCENTVNDTDTDIDTVQNSSTVTLDSATFKSVGLIVDGVNVGFSYEINKDSLSSHSLQIKAYSANSLNSSETLYDNGWLRSFNNSQYNWFFNDTSYCKDLTTYLPDTLSKGFYSFRYKYSNSTGLHRYLSSSINLYIK